MEAEGDRPWPHPPAERTDARGEFRMPGVRPGEYTVVAREGGRAPGIAAVVVEPEAEASVSILLSEGGFVTGRVVDPDGRPLAGRLRVEVFDEHGLPSPRATAWPRTRRPTARSPSAPSRRHAGDRRLRAAARDAAGSRRRSRGGRDGGPRRRRSRDRPRHPRPRARRRRQRDRRGLGARKHAASSRAPRGRSHERGRRRVPRRGAEAGDLSAHRLPVRVRPGARHCPGGGDPVDLVHGGRRGDRRPGGGRGGPAGRRRDPQSPSGRTGQAGGLGAYAAADEGEGRFVLRDLAAGGYVAAGPGQRPRRSVRSRASGSLRARGPRSAPSGSGGGGAVRGTVVDADGQGIAGATVSAERDLSMPVGGARRPDRFDRCASRSAACRRAGRASGRRTRRMPRRSPWSRRWSPEGDRGDPTRAARGARVEGRAVHRDGRPFAADWSAPRPSSRGRRGSWTRGPRSGRMDPFVRRPPRRGPDASRVPGALGSRRPHRRRVARGGPARRRDGHGRLLGARRRGGGERDPRRQPAPGVRVSLRSLEGASTILSMSSAARAARVGSRSTFLVATSQEDGRYELDRLRRRPGQGQPRERRRRPEVPGPRGGGAGRRSLRAGPRDRGDAGFRNGRRQGRRRPGVGRERRGSGGRARRQGRTGASRSRSNREIRRLEAQAHGRKQTVPPAERRPDGLSDVRVEMERGVELRGRVVDTAGRPAPRAPGRAADAAGEVGGYADTLADGSFRIDGLGRSPTRS